jgi:hypothetical protein
VLLWSMVLRPLLMLQRMKQAQLVLLRLKRLMN